MEDIIEDLKEAVEQLEEAYKENDIEHVWTVVRFLHNELDNIDAYI